MQQVLFDKHLRNEINSVTCEIYCQLETAVCFQKRIHSYRYCYF